MSIYSDFRLARDEIYKCMKCGNCQEVCPLYLATRKEVTVARGKIGLLEMFVTGEAEMTAGMAERMSYCTTCMACNEKCPCGVRFDQILLAARAEGARRHGLHPIKKTAFTMLRLQRFFNFGMKTGGKLQGAIFRRVEGRDYGARMRVDLGLLGQKKVFPRLAEKPFRENRPTVYVQKPKLRAAFFTGCMINYFYADMGEAVLGVLKHNNVEVLIPEAQGCCGTPAAVNGDVASAIELARRNLRAFEDCGAEAIVVACSSCGSAWKHSFARLLEDDEVYGPLAAKWAARTYDINEFLVRVIDYDRENLGRIERKVTYHDPCHLRRGQNIFQEPRDILRSIPGVELIELKRPDRCCGMAGSFCIVHPDLADKVLAQKMADVAQTPVQTVATGCPACRLQLWSGLINTGLPQDAVHVVQLLNESYEKAAAH
ncbi:MAG: (Fe-S)-binding protein [Gracilibacteraceae bacterium]|jgi:glycolate oxidase iron-sulfur subunit|nr:(Fe-S)-binding protein [Gracilibacteraceae bacterium]